MEKVRFQVSLVSGRAGGELSEDTRERRRLLIKIIDSKILGRQEKRMSEERKSQEVKLGEKNKLLIGRKDPTYG